MSSQVKVATHSSVFHSDDIVACALLVVAHHSVEVIRTRDMNEMSTCDYIVDVGRRRETCGDQVWIDHHQDVTSYSNGVKRAACGYVFDYLLEKGLLQFSEKEAAEFRTVVLYPVEAQDNGQEASELNVALRCNLFSFVKALNPSWTSSSNGDEEFHYTLDVAIRIIDQVITDIKATTLRDEIVNKAIEASGSNPSIIVLDKFARSWQTPVLAYNSSVPDEKKVKLVAWLDSRSGNWTAQPAPIAAGSFATYVSYPEAVRGADAADIDRYFGTNSAVFVHPAGFIGAWHEKEDLLHALHQILLETPAVTKEVI